MNMSWDDARDDVTNNVPGAKEAGIRVSLQLDYDAQPFNPRDNEGNACLYVSRRDYADYDERNDPDKPGAFDDLLPIHPKDEEWDDEDDEFDWEDDWSVTVDRMLAMGYAAAMVKETYDGGLDTTNDEDRARGVIFATPAMMREWGLNPDDPGVWQRVQDGLDAELKEYSRWATGEVYGIIIEDAHSGEELDACWGYIGYDYASGDAAREQAAYWIARAIKNKALIEAPWAAFDTPDLLQVAA